MPEARIKVRDKPFLTQIDGTSNEMRNRDPRSSVLVYDPRRARAKLLQGYRAGDDLERFRFKPTAASPDIVPALHVILCVAPNCQIVEIVCDDLACQVIGGVVKRAERVRVNS